MHKLSNSSCVNTHRSNVSIDVVESDEIPESVITLAKQKRQELLEQLAEVDDEIGEMLIMDEEPSVTQVAEAIRRATVERRKGTRDSPTPSQNVRCATSPLPRWLERRQKLLPVTRGGFPRVARCQESAAARSCDDWLEL